MKFEDALKLLEQEIQNEKLIKHCLAVAKIMEKLAERLGEDKEKWKITGLLHDIDYEKTKENMEKHGLLAREILEGKVEEDIIKAIERHNEFTGNLPKERIDFALIASDQVSGLIIASALILPSKKLKDLKLDTLKKKFKQKDFARNVKREKILYCEKLGINLEDFLELSLEALKNIDKELGL